MGCRLTFFEQTIQATRTPTCRFSSIKISTMKLLQITLLFSFISFTSFSQTLDWNLSSQMVRSEHIRDVKTDEDGNIYVTGFFTGKLTAGPDVLHAVEREFFLIKYDSNGTALWGRQSVQQGSHSTSNGGRSIALDSLGNVWVTGEITTSALFESTLVEAESPNVSLTNPWDIFIAKYDPNGNLLWIKNGGHRTSVNGSGGPPGVRDLTITSNGQVYMVGFFHDNLEFGNLAVSGHNDESFAFVARFDQNGVAQWIQHGGGGIVGIGLTMGMWIDAQENIYSLIQTSGDGGLYDGTWYNERVLLTKMDNSGQWQWIMPLGGNITGGTITGDNDGNVYATYHFFDSITIGNNTLYTPDNGSDLLVLKADVNGNEIWTEHFGGTYSEFAHDMTIDLDSNLIVGGRFRGSLDLGNFPLTSAATGWPDDDCFLFKLDRDGNVLWSDKIGTRSGYVSSLDIDLVNSIVVGGSFESNIDWGSLNDSTSHPDSSDYFLGRYRQPYTTVGISADELAGQELKVFPNPTQDVLNVQFDEAGTGARLHVVNASGSVFQCAARSTGNGYQLDLSALPSGYYIVRCEHGGTTSSVPILKM